MKHDTKTWDKNEVLAYLVSNTIETKDGCWEWQGALTKQGYGQLTIRAIEQKFGIKGTHRLMYHLVTGHEYAGRDEQILHSCDNRCCLNPQHLTLGTAKENMQAAYSRGGLRDNRGENVWNSKYTEVVVRQAMQLLQHGLTGRLIAQRLGIPENFVSRLKRGRTWRHVTKDYLHECK